MRFLVFLFLLSIPLLGQAQINLESFSIGDTTGKNIISKALYSDSLSSSFLIIVRKEVKLHRHEFHSEQVYILEGKGKMRVGEKVYNISPGSLIFIPKGIPHSLVVTSSPVKAISVQSPMFVGKDRIMLD
jgi:mannose-6-phosphate isomerase-like protein (cupin superfamily)